MSEELNNGTRDGDGTTSTSTVEAPVKKNRIKALSTQGVKSEKGKKSEGNGKASDGKKPKKKHELDPFGSRTGSNRAKLHSCLTNEPKLLGALVKEAGLAYSSFYDHMEALVAEGLIEKTEEGYRLPKKAKKAKA